MQKVIRICDDRRHNRNNGNGDEERIATLEGFRFFWPPTGEWYVFDGCDECKKFIDEVILPLIETLTPDTKFKPLSEIMAGDYKPAPRGMIWMRGSNKAKTGGLGVKHATSDGGLSSLCGLSQHLTGEPADGEDERCKQCVRFLKQQETEAVSP